MPVGIVIVHGYTGSEYDIKPLEDRLAKEFGRDSVFSVLLPGHEKDNPPEFEESLFVEEIYKNIVKARKDNRDLIVIGHSTGGNLLLATLSKYSITPSLLIFVAVPRRIDLSYLSRWERSRSGRPSIDATSLASMVKFINSTSSIKLESEFPVLLIYGDGMFYIKIGLRNIIKNFRRSLITMFSIIIGITACLLTQGFFRWNGDALKESMIRSGIGHYQLYRKGFSMHGNESPFDYLIEIPEKIEKEINNIEGLELVTTRLQFNGILSSGKKSTIVSGEAGIPENELKLNAYATLIEGDTLTSKKQNGIIIGSGVARKLSAKVGDTLTLMCNMRGGGINAGDFVVSGISKTGYNEVDNVFVSANIKNIQAILNTGKSVQKIIILLKKTSNTQNVIDKIKEICKKYNLEYRTWEELAEFYKSVKMIYDAIFVIIILIVLFIVTFTISNTVNMNIYDRIREIGTIRAVGTRRIQVAGIFIVESGLIGIIGSILGLLVTYAFIISTELIGGLPVIVRGEITRVFFKPGLKDILICVFLFTVVAIIASLHPSYKASKISITEALRWV
ncbi:MAG: alpha/beta fold hydrolase [Brevinematia bacterium]